MSVAPQPPSSAASLSGPETWSQLKALFEAMADLSPAEREARLAWGDVDDATRREVRSLLAHHPAAEAAFQVF